MDPQNNNRTHRAHEKAPATCKRSVAFWDAPPAATMQQQTKSKSKPKSKARADKEAAKQLFSNENMRRAVCGNKPAKKVDEVDELEAFFGCLKIRWHEGGN